MPGETDPDTLLASMRPLLHPDPYVFCSFDRERFSRLPLEPLCFFREEEGISTVIRRQEAVDRGFPFDSVWACITLRVHSALTAVGFLAVITDRLGKAGISVNPVSAFHHDHPFVPWMKREEAAALLRELSARHGPNGRRPDSPAAGSPRNGSGG